MTASQALNFFDDPEVSSRLQAIIDVGLEYLTLGQPLSSLSGGEGQRLKLAIELHERGSIYVLDEPTTGLHMSDVGHLLALLDRLVDGGNSVIVIEHNLDVVGNADWVIDLGPEGGDQEAGWSSRGHPRSFSVRGTRSPASIYDFGARPATRHRLRGDGRRPARSLRLLRAPTRIAPGDGSLS